jgi:ubiquinone/menaquinone biosynthesis C-methylase UbiE
VSISFDRAAGYYDATRGYSPEVGSAIAGALVLLVGASSTTKFLEIGTGTGRLALPLALKGYSVTGVDISTAMMERFRQKLSELEQAGRHLDVKLIEADMHDLPFNEGAFDAVIAAHVFHLVSDPWRTVQEALRVLRGGGSLLVCGDMITSQGTHSVNGKWREIVRRRFGTVPSSAEATDQLLRDLEAAEPALSITESRPVTWQVTTTPADELENIRQRMWSNTWLLPDDAFDECFRELELWCASTIDGQMTQVWTHAAEFVIRRVQRGATP